MQRKAGPTLAIIILLAIASISASYLGIYYYSGLRASEDFNDLAAAFHEEEAVGSLAERTEMMPGFAGLYARNNDLLGWVKISGTAIDYPVMYTPEDPEYYLRRGFEGKYSFSGTPFLDGQCAVDPRSDNLIIHGHNMKNGIMFADLLRYEEKGFWESPPSSGVFLAR